MGAQRSRLEKAGGNAELASQQLADEFAAGAPGWSAAQKAAYSNPATRDAFVQRQINQTTKGKYSGVLGKIGKAVTTLAPIAAPFIPGVGPLAAAAISAGARAGTRAIEGKSFDLGDTLKYGAGSYIGAKALGGRGVKALIGGAGKPGVTDAVSGAAGAAGAGGGGGGNLIDRAIGWAGKHPLDAAQIALAGIGTVQGAQRAGQADQLRRRALSSVDPNAPFNAGLPDETDPYNPYGGRPPINRARRAALASLVN